MGSTVFRNPRALSSALAVLGTLQPRALMFLNTVDPLDTVSTQPKIIGLDSIPTAVRYRIEDNEELESST